MCYYKEEQLDGALKAFDKALKLNENNVIAINNKIRILNELHKPEEAIELFSKEIAIN